MGKRIVRIPNSDIKKYQERLRNTEANIILFNNTTLHGRIMSISEDTTILIDKRATKHMIPVNTIQEIQFDFHANN